MPNATVLIADDERHLTHLLALKFRQEGYEVLVANDGLAALKLAVERIPDVVVSDFQMPGLSGVELAAKLREDPRTKDVPILLVTARGHRVDADELANTNVKELFPKPFSLRDLLPRVAALVAARRGEQPPDAAAAA